MNKLKTLTALFLVCSLTLGSCVDDKESKSVENIRTAKAAQLTALAAFSNAQAEAILIRAKAKALVDEATAASTNQSTEQSKQKFEIALAQLKAEAAAAVLQAEVRADVLKKEMETNSEVHINSLYSEYSIASKDLTALNNDLFKEQVTLIKVESELITWKALQARTILDAKSEILVEEATKASLSALPNNNIAAAKDALAVAKVASNDMRDRKVNLESVFKKSENVFSDKLDALGKTDLVAQAKYIIDTYAGNLVELVSVEAKSSVDAQYPVINRDPGDPIQVLSLTYPTYKANNKLIDAKVIRLEEEVININKVLGKDDGTTDPSLYKDLSDAKKAEALAKTAATAEGATASDRETYAQAQEFTYSQQVQLDAKLKEKQDAVANKAKLLAAQAAFAGDALAANTAAIAAVETAATAVVAAEAAIVPVIQEQAANWNLMSVLEIVVNRAMDIPAIIASCDHNIAKAKEKIAQAEGVSSEAEAVALSQGTIAEYNANIASKTLIVANFKALLDAALTK